MIRLLMKCGHDVAVDADKVASVTCWCGEQTVARTLNAPRPNFRGHARGPGVASTFLGPTEIDVTTAGPLGLKPDTVRKEDRTNG